MNHLALSGSLTALATPFKDGRIDEPAFVRLCQRQIACGTTALVVCGSTGEAASLSQDEQASLIRLAVTTASGQVPVIAGCGAPVHRGRGLDRQPRRRLRCRWTAVRSNALRETLAGGHHRPHAHARACLGPAVDHL